MDFAADRKGSSVPLHKVGSLFQIELSSDDAGWALDLDAKRTANSTPEVAHRGL